MIDASIQVRPVIERRVMNDNDMVVGCDVQVEFDHLRALPDGQVEGAQRVLGFIGRCAAMGDDNWGHKISNFEPIIMRIDGGLTSIIRHRRIIRAKISVIQRKIPFPFTNNQMFSGLVIEPDSPQITNYLIHRFYLFSVFSLQSPVVSLAWIPNAPVARAQPKSP